MSALIVPLLSALAVAAVVGASALYQRYQFRRTGDPPVLTLRHAATYGLGTALSSALGELWDPPLWQKALIYCAVFALAWSALKWFKRRPP